MIATIDTKGVWFGRSIQSGWIKDEFKDKFNLEYLLALFNSQYFRFLYKKIVNESAGRAFPQVKMTYLKKLPILLCQQEKQEEISSIVKKIILSKQDKKENDTKDLENQIDILIYRLYGLNEEEISIIEDQK